MFKINLKFALRHLSHNKHYSILNIVGLSFGMTCVLFILLWIFNEISYDDFHEKGNDIYKVFRYRTYNDGSTEIGETLSAPIATALIDEVPEIKAVTRIPWSSKTLFKYKEKAFFEQGIIVDTCFFNMFSFKLKQGNASKILTDPSSIVISEKLAKNYFDIENPVGKTIVLKDHGDKPFIISGIFEDIPKNSTFQFDYAISFQHLLNQQPWQKDAWGNFVLKIYIETVPSVSQDVINEKIKDIFSKHQDFDKSELFTQKFSDSHLFPVEYKEQKTIGAISQLKLIAVIALIILALACINFANLSTALSSKRAREIGIKKIIGSKRKKLTSQFFAESLIISLIAILISILLTYLFLPAFNALFSKYLEFKVNEPVILIAIIAVWLLTAFISGIYPALMMSSFRPLNVIKNNSSSGPQATVFKKILVVFQFTMAITLIIVMLTVDKQIQFVKNKDLGIDKENILFFECNNGIYNHRNAFKNDLLKLPGVKQVTYSSMNPIDVKQSTSGLNWDGKNRDDDQWFSIITTDFDFVKTFGVKLKEGRDFSLAYTTDSSNFLINEKACLAMGLKRPIGQDLSLWEKPGKIIGVVKDFNIGHLAMPIFPLIINVAPNYSQVFVKIEKGGDSVVLDNISKVFKKYTPDHPFEYTFQTDYFDEIYKNNLFMIGELSSIFCILAIIISCLGLYGLTSLAAAQRTKEIGVRKANGAKLINILRLLLTDFLKWVGIAYLIALPLGVFLVKNMLNEFAFHFQLNHTIFVYAGIAALTIAIFTVSWQTWRAATRNPVEALRYE